MLLPYGHEADRSEGFGYDRSAHALAFSPLLSRLLRAHTAFSRRLSKRKTSAVSDRTRLQRIIPLPALLLPSNPPCFFPPGSFLWYPAYRLKFPEAVPLRRSYPCQSEDHIIWSPSRDIRAGRLRLPDRVSRYDRSSSVPRSFSNGQPHHEKYILFLYKYSALRVSFKPRSRLSSAVRSFLTDY